MASLAWLAAAPSPHLLAPAQGARPLRTAAGAPGAQAGASRPGGAKAPSGLAAVLAVPAAIVGARRVARQSQRSGARRQGGDRLAAVALKAAEGGGVPEKDLKVLFETAGGGGDKVTFDQAVRLEGIDGVLEDEAASLEELVLLWGDEQKAKDFKGFCKWYGEVSKLYDDYLWKGAVAPPNAAFDDFYDEEEEIEYTDEELLEDMPTQNVSLQTLKDPTAVSQAAPVAAPSRENVEITRLFREACDENNRLSYDALRSVSEIKQLLDEEELEEGELKEMWAELPRKGDSIDVLAFRDLMGKIDELFEIVEEDEEGGLTAEDGAPAEVLDPKQVKAQLNATIDQLLSNQKEPCGLSGREETDVAVNKLCAQLETCWRETLDYIDEFEVTPVIGEWELIYSTSAKWRRWQSVLNTGDKFIKKSKFDGLVQSFRVVEGALTANEYDMEEIFITEDDEERGIRGVGSWSCYVQDNVVTGMEDLVLRIQMQAVEYDGEEENEVKQVNDDKILESQMVRTFAYSYMCYVDDEIRVMRTGLTDKSIFIFRRLED